MKVTIDETTPNDIPKNSNNRWGEWGKVDAQYSTDVTVDVLLDTGVYLRRVPVASKEWFIPDIDSERGFNSGERDLPPINARVFVFMPSYAYDDCFIAPFSGIFTFEKKEAAPYMEEEKEKIKERIMPNGWHITDDYVTGSHKAVSPDKKTSLEIDYGTEEEPKEESPELHLNIFGNIKADIIAEDNVSLSVFDEVKIDHVKGESCTLKIFDTELVIEPGKVFVKPKETEVKVNGNVTIKTSGNTTVEATGNASVKAANVEITASTGDLNIKRTTGPIGLNNGLHQTGLSPYLGAEKAAATALQTAATSAVPAMGVLDGLSGGSGTIAALTGAIIAYCTAMVGADESANTAIAQTIK